jgi:hypothetical protein
LERFIVPHLDWALAISENMEKNQARLVQSLANGPGRVSLPQGLHMGLLRGEECVSEKSKKLCVDLQKITYKAFKPIVFRKTAIRKVVEFCRNQNEAMVNRDITPMIVPP